MPDDFSQEDVARMVENIEKHDDINHGADEQQKEVERPAEGEEQAVASDFNFKTLDDLLNYELEYPAAGKQVKENLQTILKRASQGYHYAQEMNKLKSDRTAFETEQLPLVEQAKKLQEKYGKFEEYAKENPEWYNHWNNAWENRHQLQNQSGEGSTGEQQPNIQAMLKDMLAEQLGPVQEFMQQQQANQQQASVAQEDKALDEAVSTTRNEFSYVDFDKTDPESGKSLEYQVLEYMSQTGIPDFKAAFKAFYHDNLVKLQIEQAQEAQQKAEAERKKNGIIDIKTTPATKRQFQHQNLNYDQIMDRAANDPDIFPGR